MAGNNHSVRSTNHTKSSDVPAKLARNFFVEMLARPSLPNLLRADLNTLATSTKDRYETKQYAPIISIRDLSKVEEKGDTVWVNIRHKLRGQPTMCCDPLEGREEELSFTQFKINIGMWRHGARARCSMNNKRIDLISMFREARPELVEYADDLHTERLIYQLAGARGHNYNPEQNILPLDGPKFREMMINCLEAPTYCRHFYGGDANDFDGQKGDALDKDDKFTLQTLTRLKAKMKKSAHPLPRIKLPGDMKGMWLVLATPDQIRDFRNSVDGAYYRGLQAAAYQRAKKCGDHPVFDDECLYWDGFLIKEYSNPTVTFKPGESLLVSDNNDCATVHEARLPMTADFCVDRAIILGGGAVAEAWGGFRDFDGNTFGSKGPNHYAFWEGTGDGGEIGRVHIKAMDGIQKIRFASKTGRVYDHGVAVLDTAVDCDDGGYC